MQNKRDNLIDDWIKMTFYKVSYIYLLLLSIILPI